MIELFGRVGGLADPISGALARTPSTTAELREWCRIAILAIEMHEEGAAVVLYLMPDGNPEISPAKNLALTALRHISELGGLLFASDLAASVQAVNEFFDVLPILTQIEAWSRPTKLQCAVELYGERQRPKIFGKEVDPLTPARYAVIESLVKAGEHGLSTDELKSVKGDAVRYLREMRNMNELWRDAIKMAGKAWNRYRIEHVESTPQ